MGQKYLNLTSQNKNKKLYLALYNGDKPNEQWKWIDQEQIKETIKHAHKALFTIKIIELNIDNIIYEDISCKKLWS